MNVLDVEQGSKEWFDARIGSVTASRVAEAIAKRKKGDEELAVRRNYRIEMLCEMLTGVASEHYVSVWMEEGKENEPLARTAYEIERDVTVEQVGYVLHPRIARAGASPDGLVGEYGLAEFKCPKTSTHIEYILAGEVPTDYRDQMQWQMACTERQWCDFASYDPRLPERYRLFIKRLARDEKRIAEMEQEVLKFLADVDEMMDRLQEKFGGESVTARKLKQSIALVQNGKQQPVVDALELQEEDFR